MLKKYLIGTLAILAVGFALTVSAADFGTTTLRVGSKGEAVKAVQTLVGATVDGSFGPMTAAKVKAWQANNGLTADGIFGKASKAKANEVATVPTTPGTTVAGCPAGALFNSLTGAACATGTTPTTTVTGLTGSAGDVKNFRDLASYSGETLNEGETGIVYQTEIEADSGSDLALTSVRVAMKNFNGSSSKLLNRYISEVSVMNGSTKVGSVPASAFSESSNLYTANIPLTGVVVKAGSKTQLTFQVTVNGVIDSGDTTAAWSIKAVSVRFNDASGAILTADNTYAVGSALSASDKNFDVQRLSSSSTLKARVSLATSNPTSHVVKVDTSSTTNSEPILKFTVKAEGTDLEINTLPIKITTSDDKTSDVVSALFLSDGTTTLDSVSPSEVTTSETITFGGTSNMKYKIAKDTSVTFTVSANIKAQTASTYAAGTTLKAEFLPTDSITNGTVVTTTVGFDDADIRDINQNQINTTSTSRIGSALGDSMTLRSQGVSVNVASVSLGTANRNQTTNAITDQSVTYRLNVSATGSDYYIPRSVEYVAGAGSAVLPTVTGAKGFTISLLNGSDFYPAVGEVPLANVSGSVNLISGAVIDSNGLIRITDGTTAVIEVNATLTDTVAASTPVGQYRFGVLAVNANTTSVATGLTSFATLPYATFQSSTTGSFTQ